MGKKEKSRLHFGPNTIVFFEDSRIWGLHFCQLIRASKCSILTSIWKIYTWNPDLQMSPKRKPNRYFGKLQNNYGSNGWLI